MQRRPHCKFLFSRSAAPIPDLHDLKARSLKLRLTVSRDSKHKADPERPHTCIEPCKLDKSRSRSRREDGNLGSVARQAPDRDQLDHRSQAGRTATWRSSSRATCRFVQGTKGSVSDSVGARANCYPSFCLVRGKLNMHYEKNMMRFIIGNAEF
jgi:hypothetical protein